MTIGPPLTGLAYQPCTRSPQRARRKCIALDSITSRSALPSRTAIPTSTKTFRAAGQGTEFSFHETAASADVQMDVIRLSPYTGSCARVLAQNSAETHLKRRLLAEIDTWALSKTPSIGYAMISPTPGFVLNSPLGAIARLRRPVDLLSDSVQARAPVEQTTAAEPVHPARHFCYRNGSADDPFNSRSRRLSLHFL